MLRKRDMQACIVWMCVAGIVLAALFSPLGPLSSHVVSSQEGGNVNSYCDTDVLFHNKERRVPGPVNTECGSGPGHSAPWGNWGVDSNFGSRIDGFQFAGWRSHGSDPWLQWNSCTTQRPLDFPMGSTQWFNDPLPVWNKQKADPDIERFYERTGWSSDPLGLPEPSQTCADLTPEVYTYSGLYMHTYELDPGCCDAITAYINYPDIDISMTCNGSDYCEGESAWTQNNSSAGTQYAKAKIRVSIDTAWVIR